jgi:YidC/Oxa1 family membrane protein insertase
MSDQRNLFIAIGLSLVILLGFQYFYEAPRQQAQQAEIKAKNAASADGSTAPVPSAGSPATIPGSAPATQQPGVTRDAVVATSARIKVDAPRLRGSIALTGGRIDDLLLRDYKVSIEKGSPEVTLLSPPGAPSPYYANFGWSGVDGVAVPDAKTVWQASGDVLRPGQPVTLTWDNGQGLKFVRVVEIDENYLFTVTQRVENNSANPVTLYPYGLISRTGTPKTLGFYILHEGPLGVFDETLKEVDYDDLQEGPKQEVSSTGGWIGITDKYWLTALMPDQKTAITGAFRHVGDGPEERYQTDFIAKQPVTVAVGASTSVTSRLFAGAKEVNLLDRYEETLGIARFDLAVDFGWFYFLTKPLFYVLDYFFKMLGNFGLAILALTVLVKLLFFPLANKSYRAMSKMKALQPEMTRLREKYGSDRQKLNQSMMELYKKEKVNPAAGCLPIAVQIPVFFALYKVMFVTIEMRHQPFYGWIQDLSAPDPTTIFNLFGLLPWDLPQFLMIGVWPLLMGISMYLQQLLNPQPADPVQAKIFLFMPLFFTFLLATFPAGLVIYWTWNNVLSITQQWVIMKRMGVPIGRKANAKRAT